MLMCYCNDVYVLLQWCLCVIAMMFVCYCNDVCVLLQWCLCVIVMMFVCYCNDAYVLLQWCLCVIAMMIVCYCNDDCVFLRYNDVCLLLQWCYSFFQMKEMELRVQEADQRAAEAEDRVSWTVVILFLSPNWIMEPWSFRLSICHSFSVNMAWIYGFLMQLSSALHGSTIRRTNISLISQFLAI